MVPMLCGILVIHSWFWSIMGLLLVQHGGCCMALLGVIDVTDVMPHGALCCLGHASLLLPPVNVHFSHFSP